MRRLLVLAAIAACGKSAGPATSGSGAGTGSGTAVAEAHDAPPPAQGKDFIALLAAQSKPTLVGPWAPVKLAPELSIAQLRTQAPELAKQENAMHALDWFEYKGTDFAGTSLRLERIGQIDSDPDAWLVGRLRAVVTDATAKERLTKAWGPPRSYGARSLWFDPAAHVRCALTAAGSVRVDEAPEGAQVVDCDYYTPLEELIGTDKTRFGFEGDTPLLGATEAQVKARFGRRVVDNGTKIWLPPTELAERIVEVELTDEMDAPDKVTYWKLQVAADQPTIEKLLLAKLGKPKVDEDVGMIYRAKGPRIVVRGSQIIVGDEPKP